MGKWKCLLRWDQIFSYLIDDNNDNKKAKCKENSVMKGNLKFEDPKNCVDANGFENKIDYFKKDIKVDSLKENHKNRLRVKPQQNYNKDLEVRKIVCLQKNLIRLH